MIHARFLSNMWFHFQWYNESWYVLVNRVNHLIWINLSAEERKQYTYPGVDYLWTKILEEDRTALSQKETFETIAAHEVYLNQILKGKITSLKNDLPDLIQQSRQEENPLRSRLNKLFMANRKYPADFAMQADIWAKRGDYYDSLYIKTVLLWMFFPLQEKAWTVSLPSSQHSRKM